MIMKKTYTLALNCGYAENASLSFTPFTSHLKYASAKDALLDLANFFKEQYDVKFAAQIKTCCKINLSKKDSDAQYCSKCGTFLYEEDTFDDTLAFVEFVNEICQADCNAFHGDYIDYDEQHRWQPEGFEEAVANGSVRFVYTAEKVMAAAIGQTPDHRVTIDQIFKERTGKGSKSFSFW